MKLTNKINKLLEEKIDKSNYKTLLRDGDRVFSRDKKTGDKYQTLFVKEAGDGMFIRSGASNGEILFKLHKPKITVGDLVRELDKKPHNWNTKKLDMSLNEDNNNEIKSLKQVIDNSKSAIAMMKLQVNNKDLSDSKREEAKESLKAWQEKLKSQQNKLKELMSK